MENNHDEMKELRSMMMDLVKQNMQVSQRMDQRMDALSQRMEQSNASLSQRMEQSNVALSQRIDGMVQQNLILGQRMDMTTSRIDASIQQLQTQQLDIAKMFYTIKDCLDKLPEALKDQIGFRK
jgi:uncharacterized protein (DUF342 family)